MRRGRAAAVLLVVSVLGFGSPAHAVAPTASSWSAQTAVAVSAVTAKKKPRAQIVVTYARLTTGRVQVAAASNAKSVQVRYRNAKK